MSRKKKSRRPAGYEADAEIADNDTGNVDNDTVEVDSKTQRKKEMHRLQALGKELLSFSQNELARISLSAELLLALEESKRIKSREALRRHTQYIGKLMRSEEIEPIEEAIRKKRDGHREMTQRHHQVEAWRDRILETGSEAIEAFMLEYPEADRQWLNQVRRKHLAETNQGKPPASARKLFTYIRDQMTAS